MDNNVIFIEKMNFNLPPFSSYPLNVGPFLLLFIITFYRSGYYTSGFYKKCIYNIYLL
jgi:hypothetical protein